MDGCRRRFQRSGRTCLRDRNSGAGRRHGIHRPLSWRASRRMSAKLKAAVLISGRGSNLQALIDACADAKSPAQIVLVISNVAGAQGLERAREAGIATEVIQHTNYDRRESFDAAMDVSLT